MKRVGSIGRCLLCLYDGGVQRLGVICCVVSRCAQGLLRDTCTPLRPEGGRGFSDEQQVSSRLQVALPLSSVQVGPSALQAHFQLLGCFRSGRQSFDLYSRHALSGTGCSASGQGVHEADLPEARAAAPRGASARRLRHGRRQVREGLPSSCGLPTRTFHRRHMPCRVLARASPVPPGLLSFGSWAVSALGVAVHPHVVQPCCHAWVLVRIRLTALLCGSCVHVVVGVACCSEGAQPAAPMLVDEDDAEDDDMMAVEVSTNSGWGLKVRMMQTYA